MIPLKQEQIEWIRTDLEKRGLLYPPLREEIVDHICETVEAEMLRGVTFMDAYRRVVISFGPHGLPGLNQKTIHAIGALAMLKSYFTIAFRSLRRHRLPTFINLLGLVVGISSCLLILLYVQDERSYDSYHVNADRIFRLTTRLTFEGREDHAAFTQNGIASQLASDYPTVEKVIRLRFNKGFELTRNKITVKVPAFPGVHAPSASPGLFSLDKALYLYDEGFFDVFTHPMLAGNPKTALARPGSVVITQSLAEQFFGPGWQSGKGVLGKVLAFNADIYQVTGVIRDVPPNTDLPFRALLRRDNKELEPMSWCTVYVMFKDAHGGEAFGPELQKIAAKIQPDLAKRGASIAFFLENLLQVHLGSPKTFDTPKANPMYLSLFSVVAGFLLLIASINYVNLSIAQSAGRSTEVRVRKVIGAARLQLLVQFLGESLLLTLAAVSLSLLLAALVLPFYNQIAEKSFSLRSLISWQMSGLLLLIFILVGLLAGSYPALYLSSFEAVRALKGKLRLTGSSLKGVLGRGLVVLQFTISVSMITGTLIVYKQLHYLQAKNLGFRKEHVLVVDVPRDPATLKQLPQLKASLSRYASFRKVALSGSMSLPGQQMNLAPFNFGQDGQMVTVPQRFIDIDEHYLALLNIPLVAGRGFTPGEQASMEVLVNEALVRKMDWGTGPQAAIGRHVSQGRDEEASSRTIVGVVRDFHFQSPHNPIEPLLLFNNANHLPEKVLVGLSAGKLTEQIDIVQREWERLVPDHPFGFTFLDETFGQQYRQERRLVPIFTYFSFLTILVACLGLFGLISFATRQRIKEIGIRKVLGAHERGLVFLLSGEFLLLVALAILIASPLAWWGMNHWLQGFAYRIAIDVGVFVLAGGITALIAVLTTGYQALKAARANPIRVLRYE